MIELVRNCTEDELMLLLPFMDADKQALAAVEDAQKRKEYTGKALELLASKLEPDADFDPNIRAFVRTRKEGE